MLHLLNWVRKPAAPRHELDYDERCDAWVEGECRHKAQWGAWSTHGHGHEELFCYCCDSCKRLAEQRFEKLMGFTCSCGYNVEGTIDQHLRFMKL